MSIRVRLACVAALVGLATAQASHAQEADSALAARSGARPGRGSVGGQIGVSKFVSEGDYSSDSDPRFSFAGQFRYVISPSFRWQASPYFTWTAYKVGSKAPFPDPIFNNRTIKDFYLTQMVGMDAQIQWTLERGKWVWHLGAGPAVYRIVVQDSRKVIRDPLTDRLHQGTYAGAAAEWGVERFMKMLPNTSLEWTIAYHTAFAKRDAQFPSGWNGMASALETRVGAHYYYDFKKSKSSGSGRGTRP